MGETAAAKGTQTMRSRRPIAFLALTPVAPRAPFVSAKNAKSVYHVPGTKCIPCASLDRESSRLFRIGAISCIARNVEKNLARSRLDSLRHASGPGGW